MRSTMTCMVMLCGLMMTLSVDIAAQGARRPSGFQPDRRLFSRLFTRPRIRIHVPPDTRRAARESPANRECAGCEERPGTVHLLLDSPRLSSDWLARHTYQANGGSFGDNVAIADFWYDAVHRRLFSRSLVLQEVDDPADLRLGRAPGTYPNDIDLRATLDEGTTVGHVGFVSWTHNGFGSYFAAVQGAVGSIGTGYLDLSTATGESGTTRTGSRYDGSDLIKHLRLYPSGQFEVGFETSPDARPDVSLLVRGHTNIENGLSVGGTVQAEALAVDRVETTSLTIAGGGVPHACSLRSRAGARRDASVSCDPGQIAMNGGGACASGELRASHPTQAGDSPDGWMVTCTRNGTHTAYVVCCAK